MDLSRIAGCQATVRLFTDDLGRLILGSRLAARPGHEITVGEVVNEWQPYSRAASITRE